MNKKLLAIAFGSLFCAAAANAADSSAVLDITGTVTQHAEECVYSVPATVTVNSTIDSVGMQDVQGSWNNAASMPIFISDAVPGGPSACYGKVAIYLHGQADTAKGNVLANTDVSETAAKGVGIAMALANGQVLTPDGATFTPSTSVENINFYQVQLSGQKAEPGTVQSNLTIDFVRL